MAISKYIIGLDEVGRGPLAGPVTVAAVALPYNFKFHPSSDGINFKLPLRDSKKLTANQRERWAKYIKIQPRIFHAVASVYPKIIDRINISQAANLAATRAAERLLVKCKIRHSSRQYILLDGGLFLNKSLLFACRNKLIARTIVRGDEKFNSIKLASIIAKVSRDRLLKRYHKKYPQYGFDEHKGYGTMAHLIAIKRYGPSAIHRLTFCSKFIKMKLKD
ncbi:MAG: ribonuclease HII [Patescibacteria group bacterium]|mgnify:CR=1 FL=1